MYVWHLSRSGPEGKTGWEACENIPHVLAVASPPVSLSLRLCRSINVSEPSLVQSPQKPCFRLSLLWARCRGLTQGNETYTKKENTERNVMWDVLFHTTQTLKEKSRCWLHFIFLIEPPAAPTSRAGPAYQDLKGRRQRPLETRNSQDWPIRVQTQVPEAKGGRRDLLFLLPVSLSLSPVLHKLLVIKLRC